MEDRNVKRGDIYHADLDPVFGSEQGGYRPVLVIQNNIGNQYSPTVIVAAITSKEKMKLPTHIAVPEMEGLEKDSVVLLEQAAIETTVAPAIMPDIIRFKYTIKNTSN